MTKYYIAVASDPAAQITIDGLGHTAEEAIADAHQASGADTDVTSFISQPCTRALYEYVLKNGGADMSWGENDRGLQDLDFFSDAEVAFIVDYIIEVVEESHAGGGDNPGTWTVEEALDTVYQANIAGVDEDAAERVRLLVHPEMNAIVRAQIADWIESSRAAAA